jgi:hypothetical protein
MMKRIVLAGIVGGVVLFVWGAVAWMVVPLHTPTIKTLPNEDAIRSVLREAVKEPGVYSIPGYPQGQSMSKQEAAAAMSSFEAKHRAGPVGVLVLRPQGGEPMEARVFLSGFILQVAVAAVAAWLLSLAAGNLRSYGARVQFVTVLGAFAALAVDLQYWNWWAFPTDYTIGMVADHVIGWFLAGLALAAIVKPAS